MIHEINYNKFETLNSSQDSVVSNTIKKHNYFASICFEKGPF